MSQDREGPLHKAIVTYLRLVLPFGFLVHHCANKPRSKQQGAREKALGALSGWPDLEVHGRTHDGRPHLWCFEIKPKGVSVPPHQLAMHDRLRDIGWSVAVVRSVEDVTAWLVRWDVPLRVSGRSRGLPQTEGAAA